MYAYENQLPSIPDKTCTAAVDQDVQLVQWTIEIHWRGTIGMVLALSCLLQKRHLMYPARKINRRMSIRRLVGIFWWKKLNTWLSPCIWGRRNYNVNLKMILKSHKQMIHLFCSRCFCSTERHLWQLFHFFNILKLSTENIFVDSFIPFGFLERVDGIILVRK